MLTSQKTRQKIGRLAWIYGVVMLSGMTLATQAASADETLQYQPTVVTLEGEIDMQQFDGPPGYGDGPDDKKVEVPVLQLAKPVTVVPLPDTPEESPDSETARNVTEMQVLSHKGPVKISGCYRITGTLMHQVIADHYTPVLIIMDSAEPSHNCP